MKGNLLLQTNKIFNEDCLLGIKKIPDNSIDLVIIDPPYDICTKGGKTGNSRVAKEVKSLEKELIDNFRKKVFDLCDDASVHLSLTSNENTAFILRNLQKILQIIV